MQKDTSKIVEELGICPDFQTFYNENKDYMVSGNLSALLAQLDERGYFAAREDCLTATPGVFVAGDCRAKRIRQVTTAAADGAVAALAACDYLN